MVDLRIGTARRIASDRELARFINAKRVTPDTLGAWEIARSSELAPSVALAFLLALELLRNQVSEPRLHERIVERRAPLVLDPPA